jgi:hypothetical protein
MSQSIVKFSKEDKKKNTTMSKKIINNRIDQIDNFEKDIIKKIKNDELNNPTDIKAVFSITETAKSQLEKGGSQFTKADLISIAIALDPSKLSKIEDLKQLRITDLISIIRTIIYDTNRYIMAVNSNHINDFITNNDMNTNIKKNSKNKNILQITDNINIKKKPTKKIDKSILQIMDVTDVLQIK